MKINSCLQHKFANVRTVDLQKIQGTSNSIKSSNKSFPPFEIAKKHNLVFLSFTGANNKNLNQLASIAPEYQGPLNSVYKVGGLGNVAGEAAVALQEHGNMDVRTFVPYYSGDNSPNFETGFVKIRRPIKDKTWKKPVFNGTTPVYKDGQQVFEEVPAFEFVSVYPDYRLNDGEEFVIHEPVKKGLEWRTGYKVIEKTDISGSVAGISEDLQTTKHIPYHIFKIKETGPNVKGKPTVYLVHTPELSVFPKAYGTKAYEGKFFDDYIYSIFSRASVDAIEKMSTSEAENFNPGNLWLHDRQAFPAMMEISERSGKGKPFWSGIRAHASYHNPGRNYQGHYINPIDFFRINGTQDDLYELKKNPGDYAFVRKMNTKLAIERAKGEKFAPEEILTKEELKKLDKIFDPLYGQFKDELGEYNLCKIPVVGVRKNPYNFSCGTVSRTYGKEMKNHNTKEIALGLTSDFASIPTIDIVNGSSAKSLGLDVVGDFGANNGFTEEVKAGFTPLTPDITADKDKLFTAKQANKKWIIDTISKASDDEEQLAKLFFSEDKIKDGSSVIGGLSKFSEGDVLFIGWGRPDTQKGFPTTIEGFLQFFKNPNISDKTKSHAKVLLGAGVWGQEDDWKTIQKQISEIQSLEGGKYKNNICYLNGFFSNRIVACADYTNITSRYEPCGITPLESYAGGTPVISNNTGGSPDFIKPVIKGAAITDETGFLTKNAYLVNPEVIGANPNLKGVELDTARRLALGKENSDCIEQAMDIFHNRPEDYKKLMMNAVNSKTDWHENGAFNQGKSALELYKEQAWNIDSENKELAGKVRNTHNLFNLRGKIKENFKNSDTEASKSFFLEKEFANNFTGRIKKLISESSISKKCAAAFALVLGITAVSYIIHRAKLNSK